MPNGSGGDDYNGAGGDDDGDDDNDDDDDDDDDDNDDDDDDHVLTSSHSHSCTESLMHVTHGLAAHAKHPVAHSITRSRRTTFCCLFVCV